MSYWEHYNKIGIFISALFVFSLTSVIYRYDFIILALLISLFLINSFLFSKIIEIFLEKISLEEVEFETYTAYLHSLISIDTVSIGQDETIKVAKFSLKTKNSVLDFCLETKNGESGEVLTEFNVDYWKIKSNTKIDLLVKKNVFKINNKIWKIEDSPIYLDHYDLEEKFFIYEKRRYL